MSKLRQILRLYSQGEKKLKISTLTGVSRNTLKKYLRIYQGLGLSIKDIEMLSDKNLRLDQGKFICKDLAELEKQVQFIRKRAAAERQREAAKLN